MYSIFQFHIFNSHKQSIHMYMDYMILKFININYIFYNTLIHSALFLHHSPQIFNFTPGTHVLMTSIQSTSGVSMAVS